MSTYPYGSLFYINLIHCLFLTLFLFFLITHTKYTHTTQVSVSEESRNLRGQLESLQLVSTATHLEVQDLRSKLVAETREKKDIEEQHLLLTNANQNLLQDLTKTKESNTEMEDEIEIVKSELRGATGELESYRESLDSAENLITSLQNDVQEIKAQVRTWLSTRSDLYY